MALTANQIYAPLNAALKEAFGESAIAVKDTAGFVSAGKFVFDSQNNTDAMYGAILNVVGRTIMSVREKKSSNSRKLKRDEMEWGLVMRKIIIDPPENTENSEWTPNAKTSPYDVEQRSTIKQKLFAVLGTFSNSDSIPTTQMYTAFHNEYEMAAFMSALEIAMKNYITADEEALENLTVATGIASVLIEGKAAQKRMLLTEYNALAGTALTAATARQNADFLRYAAEQIALVTQRLDVQTREFNADGVLRHTPADMLEVDILGEFVEDINRNYRSDVFNKELAELPNKFNKVPFWQAPGTGFDFESCSTVSVKNAELATSDNENGEITKSGVVAYVRDIEAVGCMLAKLRTWSIVDQKNSRYNYGYNRDYGFFVDPSEQMVVFVLE